MEFTQPKHDTLFGQTTDVTEMLSRHTTPNALRCRAQMRQEEPIWQQKREAWLSANEELRSADAEYFETKRIVQAGVTSALRLGIVFELDEVIAFASARTEASSDVACLERLEEIYRRVQSPDFGFYADKLNQRGNELRSAEARRTKATAALAAADQEYAEAYFTIQSLVGMSRACLKSLGVKDVIKPRKRAPSTNSKKKPATTGTTGSNVSTTSTTGAPTTASTTAPPANTTTTTTSSTTTTQTAEKKAA